MWEINSMRALVDQLEKYMQEIYRLRLFYSFQILRLGKEFDLLQVKENQIVNIELKSGAVSEDAIRRQLIQNRYYLAIIAGKECGFFWGSGRSVSGGMVSDLSADAAGAIFEKRIFPDGAAERY